MTKRILAIVGLMVMGTSAVLGIDSPSQAGLKLEPQPKEVQLRDGEFRVSARTRIFVQLGHQTEDRIAAETLAEEVEQQSGIKLDILGMAAGKTEDRAIMLARLDDRRVRHFLAKRGLRADEAVGANGYLLFSDHSHLIVAANTGQGLFYGVQTLRQLLRPAAKGLTCPAVGIRDWPSLQRTTAPDDVSREEPVKSELRVPQA
ncbi:MAG TPA: glycoside hydrolase family 20 zincin-like fold domain-containing protein [Candidatus Dormibacteraeota bacterium]|nr:glycoside hydrolase family 20 zincin-like fold domain-containing protein [Candidatus Dormibacteraeota bacterium]